MGKQERAFGAFYFMFCCLFTSERKETPIKKILITNGQRLSQMYLKEARVYNVHYVATEMPARAFGVFYLMFCCLLILSFKFTLGIFDYSLLVSVYFNKISNTSNQALC